MDTSRGFELCQIPLSLPFMRKRRDELLARCGLRGEPADYAVGVYDRSDRLVATASLSGDVIKCVATLPSARGEALTPAMVTAIMGYASQQGITNLRVFTKPDYEDTFASMAFRKIGEGTGCVLMEQSTHRLKRYCDYLGQLERHGRVGCIVVNANPMTIGHLYLIEKAAAETDTLFVIPVADDTDGGFSYRCRVRILRRATAHLPSVQVVEGSPYAVSRATFPSYFIKELSDLTTAHISLDLDIFLRHIAPALGATVRFVGTEPTDALTAAYNEEMRRLLPAAGIELREIARLTEPGAPRRPVSASRVRELVESGHCSEALPLVVEAAIPNLLARAASAALRAELNLTPKPGLVDRANSGAHTDMDYPMMMRSIEALEPVFAHLAEIAEGSEPDPAELRAIGIEGERRMAQATGGVNTHRGALFSLGLAVVGAAHIHSLGQPVTIPAIRDMISSIAYRMPRPEGTHGQGVHARYGIPGALEAARDGYPEAAHVAAMTDSYRMLIFLMSRIEDSNVWHRGGAEAAAYVKSVSRKALKATESELPRLLRQLDADFTARGISPGGAADMLALAFFLKSVSQGSATHRPDNL
ncbi:MAG: triphosphoribosyl-dephospho-CoA synthase [Muribaculaceae bacterium]|nr:triphosphoribosyl-dephospho-CoA synthase [Muribaculaceae bacterium]